MTELPKAPALACLALLCIDGHIFENESFFSNTSVIAFQSLAQFCIKKILSGHQFSVNFIDFVFMLFFCFSYLV